MLARNQGRQRRATKTRSLIKRQMRNEIIKGEKIHWLTVHKTPRHIYAQVLDASGKVLAIASTLQAEVKKNVKNGGNIDAAKSVGKKIAELAKLAKVEKVAFDRSGFKYHGRIKALAEAAREAGLNF